MKPIGACLACYEALYSDDPEAKECTCPVCGATSEIAGSFRVKENARMRPDTKTDDF